MVITMSQANRSPWFNMVTQDGLGLLHLIQPHTSTSRRQDSPTCFDMSTVAYVSTPAFILSSSKIWDGRVRGITIPPERSVDIDTPLDFAIAKFLKEQYIPILRVSDHV